MVGFPLHGLVNTDINVTKGIVSSLVGAGDRHSNFQITAPIQPGNSGGPVLDAAGNVVGVVVSTLDGLKAVSRTGSIPQNVNFAISEGVARTFLEAHNVPYKLKPSTNPASTVQIAYSAKGYTVLIECNK